jgi:hypothetical protein
VRESLPACRATVRDGRLTLNRWTPGLRDGGPERSGFRTLRAALADLHIDGEELVVSPVERAPWPADADAVVIRWAACVGYRRVWLRDRVVDLGAVLPPLGRAAVDCPTCGAHWEDGSVAFWEGVRRAGAFPGRCLACGGSLPEWSCQNDPSSGDPETGPIEQGGDVRVSERGNEERHG